MDQRIRIGDKVTLQSGGPVMTVQAISLSLAYCAWDAGGQLHHGTFETGNLAPVSGAATAQEAQDGEQPSP